MNRNIDALLQQSLPVLSDDGFSKQVLNTLIKRQQGYLKLRQKIMTCSIFVCITILSVFLMLFEGNLPLTNKLIDLSSLFLGINPVYIVSGMMLVIAFYVTSESLEGN